MTLHACVTVVHARTYARTYARMDARTHGRTDARTHARTRARTNARTDARTHGRSHARTHARTYIHARTHARTHIVHQWLCLPTHESPVVHQNVRTPYVFRRDANALNVAILRLVPRQIVVIPLL